MLRRLVVPMLFVAALVAGGCSDDNDGGGGGGGGDASGGGGGEETEAACEALRPIDELNRQAGELSAQLTADFATTRDALIPVFEDLLDIYEEAILGVPDNLAGNLETLRDFTESFIPALRDSADVNAFQAAVQDVPGAQEAGQAGTAVNTFTQQRCDFSVSSPG